jgi:hypothetical protein
MLRRFLPIGDGCGYILMVCVVSCCFLLMNGALFSAVYTYLTSGGPPWLENPRIEQLVKLVVPVLMLVLEWRLVDLLGDLVASASPNLDPPARNGAAPSKRADRG